MSEYQQEPNQNWLEANQGETVVLRFPYGEYAVTIHSDEETGRLLAESGGEVYADD